MRNRILRITLAALVAAATHLTMTVRAADAAVPASLFACGQHPRHVAAMRAPCSEIDRAVGEAADEFGLDHRRFRQQLACESHLVDTAGRSYVGLGQQSPRYGPARMAAFDRANSDKLGNRDLRHPFTNARLSAWMLAERGWGDWPVCGRVWRGALPR